MMVSHFQKSPPFIVDAVVNSSLVALVWRFPATSALAAPACATASALGHAPPQAVGRHAPERDEQRQRLGNKHNHEHILGSAQNPNLNVAPNIVTQRIAPVTAVCWAS